MIDFTNNNSLTNEYTTWSVYDSMIQSYRSNMIASQSLLLAVASILFEKNILLEAIVCTVGLFQLWYIWFRIIRARAIISDFHKFNAFYNFCSIIGNDGHLRVDESGALNENASKPLDEGTYVRKKKVRDLANNNLADLTGIQSLRTNLRLTRKKLDIIMPITFTLIWIMLIVIQAWEYLTSLM